jgi:hypothetical protein
VDLDLFGSATFSQVALKLFPRRMVYESGTGQVHTGFGDVTELEVTVDLLRFQGQSPALTVVVQHSDDGSSWTDMLTFAGVGEDEETDTFTGDVKDQVRVAWTLTGTNAAANFSVSARVLDADAPASGGTGLPAVGSASAGAVLRLDDSEEPEWTDVLGVTPESGVQISPTGFDDPAFVATSPAPAEEQAAIFMLLTAELGMVFQTNSDGSSVFDLGAGANFRVVGLPTADPSFAGAFWNDNGTLKISAG